jgi:hypothetical protein
MFLHLCTHLPYFREIFAPYLTEDDAIKEIPGSKFVMVKFSKYKEFSNFLLLKCVLQTCRGLFVQKPALHLTIFHLFVLGERDNCATPVVACSETANLIQFLEKVGGKV